MSNASEEYAYTKCKMNKIHCYKRKQTFSSIVAQIKILLFKQFANNYCTIDTSIPGNS